MGHWFENNAPRAYLTARSESRYSVSIMGLIHLEESALNVIFPRFISNMVLVATAWAAWLFLTSCRWSHASSAEGDIGPSAAVHVSLKSNGLPDEFFLPGHDTECSNRIIGYRFVAWLDDGHVAVGFNTSPNCRLGPDRMVQGELRILMFDLNGTMTAKRDMPYLADGNGELVADGEAMPGPGGTLLIRIESVNLDEEGRHESPSSVRLLDSKLRDIVQMDRFLEQTTLVEHALVFQEGIVFSGPRNYSILSGPDLKHVEKRQVDWPAGTRTRKFGEHEIAFIHCEQEFKPGQFVSTNVVLAGAKVRCSLNVLGEKEDFWTRQLADGQGANVVGVLGDGSVVGETYKNSAHNLVLWRKDRDPELLPWVPAPLDGEINSSSGDFSRYAMLAVSQDRPCNPLTRVIGGSCDDQADGRWFIFDRKLGQPVVNRAFPRNGRAALSPDGLHYASFEAGELRVYSLPK